MVKVRFKDVNGFKVSIAESGKTIRSFSKEIGVDGSFLRVVTKRNRISPPYAKKICDALGKKFSDLFETFEESKGGDAV